MGNDGIPPGYVRFETGGRQVTATDWAADAIRAALSHGTLYEWAAAKSSPELFRGRGISYGVQLPAGVAPDSETSVVIRRNRHGGLLRVVTGEYFFLPTRAPLELETAVRLAAAGVPTPEVIATVVYPVGGMVARSDVMTRRLPPGGDFPEVWRGADTATRDALLRELAALLRALNAAGAWHADLNLKNIYIAGFGPTLQAHVLDVDRVTFPWANDIAGRNLARLSRSARKWRERWGLDFDEDALERLTSMLQERA